VCLSVFKSVQSCLPQVPSSIHTLCR
jgi:hypothetical protein